MPRSARSTEKMSSNRPHSLHPGAKEARNREFYEDTTDAMFPNSEYPDPEEVMSPTYPGPYSRSGTSNSGTSSGVSSVRTSTHHDSSRQLSGGPQNYAKRSQGQAHSSRAPGYWQSDPQPQSAGIPPHVGGSSPHVGGPPFQFGGSSSLGPHQQGPLHNVHGGTASTGVQHTKNPNRSAAAMNTTRIPGATLPQEIFSAAEHSAYYSRPAPTPGPPWAKDIAVYDRKSVRHRIKQTPYPPPGDMCHFRGCGFGPFFNQNEFQAHVDSHEFQYCCTFERCEGRCAIFPTPQKLGQHVDEVHRPKNNGKPAFTWRQWCSEPGCVNDFLSEASFISHYERKHPGIQWQINPQAPE